MEAVGIETSPVYDPACYLCPGNERAGGVRNPPYDSTFVFDNDFAALRASTEIERRDRGGLLVAESEPGICRVVCFSPRHDLTIAGMAAADLRMVVDTWADQFLELGGRAEIGYVQIFENRGAMMGASNSHPHCQIWASRSVPTEVAKEQTSMEAWNGCLLCDYARLELAEGIRVVDEGDHFFTVVPFWAIWPFETLILAKRHVADIAMLSCAERDGLAAILQRTTARYDRLFRVSFPYSMGFHQRPTDGEAHQEWHFHGHFFPPLLRSATVRKFLVGYEMLASPQRDLTPEAAAERLRDA